MKLTVDNLACGYDGKTVIDRISLSLNPHETLCLLGPNGVGKTTFFKTLLGFLKPLGGRTEINGKGLHRLSIRERAKIMAYVPQAHEIPFPFSVEEIVIMGRNVHCGRFSVPTEKDRAAAFQCLEELGVAHLAKRCFTQISGGEKQMVLIARALAQEALFLVMDEPASNLDFGNQINVLNHINRLRRQKKGIILTTHSPDHVFLCGTHVAVFHRNRTMQFGEPHSVITGELLQELYDVEVQVHEMEMAHGARVKMCVPCL